MQIKLPRPPYRRATPQKAVLPGLAGKDSKRVSYWATAGFAALATGAAFYFDAGGAPGADLIGHGHTASRRVLPNRAGRLFVDLSNSRVNGLNLRGPGKTLPAAIVPRDRRG